MRYFRSFICLLLLVTISISPLHAYDDFSQYHSGLTVQEQWIENLHRLTYDEILHLLDEIESGALEKKCSFVHWEKINRFLFTLATEGALAQDRELESDEIGYENAFFLENDQDYIITHAINYGDGEVFYCKSSKKNAWQKTKKFIRDHKKEIIIGVVIVVAVVAVVTIAVVTSAAVAATAAAAGAGSAVEASNIKEPPEQNHSQVETEIEEPYLEVSPNPIVVNQSSNLREIVYEHLEPIKELAGDNFDWSFQERARELGARLTHEALNGVAELTSILPELQQELIDLAEKFLPQSLIPEETKYPKTNFDGWIAQGHEKIDNTFSTDQAEYYTSGAKAQEDARFNIGVIPPVAKVLKVSSNGIKIMVEAGKNIDRAGFTKAGRSLMKHGYREGSFYPKPVGNPKQINEHGQKILESILNHPEKIIYEYTHRRFGKVIDVVVPEKGGVRFTASGEMIHFMEPEVL